jgi:hypothetical protein
VPSACSFFRRCDDDCSSLGLVFADLAHLPPLIHRFKA